MKTKFAATTLIVASAMLAGSPSFAQVTREQVKAELAAAILGGDIATGQRSLKLNELYPSRYPAQQVQSTLTRAQVKAELIAALRSGDYAAPGEESGLCREVHPDMHALK
jgi:hypothetical protein